MNSVTISGQVLKQYGDILPAGRLFIRLVIQNDQGVFVVVGYGNEARAMAAAREGARVVVHGSLRQRKPNGRTLWEIVVEQILVLEGGNGAGERLD